MWLAQAEDRCHRKGQRSAVNVTVLLAHTSAESDAFAATAEFDARHASILKQSERVVGRVTDGPRTRRSSSKAGSSITPASSSTALVVLPPSAVTASSASEELSVWFECSSSTGRVHVFLSRHDEAPAADDAEDEDSSKIWWTHHSSFAAEELPSPPPTDASQAELPATLMVAATEDDTALRVRLIDVASTFLAGWRSLSAHSRRRVRGDPLQASQLLPLLPNPASAAAGSSDALVTTTTSTALVTASPSPSPSKRRARPRLEADEGAPDGVIWGVAHVMQRFRSSAAMPLAVSADGTNALCLACYTTLKQPPTGFSFASSSEGTSPSSSSPAAAISQPEAGPQAWPLGDAELFCGGRCRADWFARRCGSSLRRQLSAADGSVCAACGLDAASVCQALCEAPPGAARMALLERLAPNIAGRPALAMRLLEAPHLEGNCWHADHILEVADGGGECTVDNMQVLCVACHAEKSGRWMRSRARGSPAKQQAGRKALDLDMSAGRTTFQLRYRSPNGFEPVHRLL